MDFLDFFGIGFFEKESLKANHIKVELKLNGEFKKVFPLTSGRAIRSHEWATTYFSTFLLGKDLYIHFTNYSIVCFKFPKFSLRVLDQINEALKTEDRLIMRCSYNSEMLEIEFAHNAIISCKDKFNFFKLRREAVITLWSDCIRVTKQR